MSALGRALLPMAYGLLMVGATAYGAHGLATVAAGTAVVAVLVSVWWPPAATGAVLLGVLTVVLAEPAPVYTALAGLAAAAYLVAQQGVPTPATATFAVAFAAAATAAVALPVTVRWLPLLAPLVLLAAYVSALWPFVTGVRLRPQTAPAESSADIDNRYRFP